MEKKESSCTLGGTVNWCNHYRKHYAGSSKKLKIELPYDLEIPLLDIYLKETKTLFQKDICTPMFIAALFYNSQDMEATSMSIDRWMDKDAVYIYRMEYYSSIKKKKISPFVTWIDPEGTTLCEISRRKQIPYDFTYMWNLKTTIAQTLNSQREQIAGRQRGGRLGVGWNG